ncbi:MAG TPA: alpha/beta hydrolase [Erysipelotrichaceae bacterium]|nr:alpha/beta hydrolase [Erysipelotrichaceae bacterium]
MKKWILAAVMLSMCACAQPSEEEAEHMSYTTREITVQNGDMRIYGIAYIPAGEEKHPLVIFSHELGNSHTSGTRYAEKLAEAGYAAYTFDFCGGTVGGNQSDGNNVGMSVMTEVSDLEAVIKDTENWEFADTSEIYLLGGSQGAVVTAVTGCRNEEKIQGMMLMYPPLILPDDMHERFASKEEIPEEFDMFGGWIHVGRNYAADIWDLNVYDELSKFQKDVLLLHGDADHTVEISVSEKAAELIPHCEFYTVKGGGHEFFNAQFEDAMAQILAWLSEHMQ